MKVHVLLIHDKDRTGLIECVEEVNREGIAKNSFDFLLRVGEKLKERGIPYILFKGLDALDEEQINRILGWYLTYREDYRKKLRLKSGEHFFFLYFPDAEEELDPSPFCLRERHWLFRDLVF